MRNLLAEHVGYQLAANREVGVLQARMDRVDHRGESVGKSDEADVVVTVPQALGLTVPDGDVSACIGAKARAQTRD